MSRLKEELKQQAWEMTVSSMWIELIDITTLRCIIIIIIITYLFNVDTNKKLQVLI